MEISELKFTQKFPVTRECIEDELKFDPEFLRQAAAALDARFGEMLFDRLPRNGVVILKLRDVVPWGVSHFASDRLVGLVTTPRLVEQHGSLFKKRNNELLFWDMPVTLDEPSMGTVWLAKMIARQNGGVVAVSFCY